MKLKFNIAKKLILSFGIVTGAILVSIYLINKNLSENINISTKTSKVYISSAKYTNVFSNAVVNSQMLLKDWIYIEKENNTPNKLKLVKLLNTDIPKLNEKLLLLSHNWDTSQQVLYKQTYVSFRDTLVPMYQEIINNLSTSDDYENNDLLSEIYPQVSNTGKVIVLGDILNSKLLELNQEFENKIKETESRMLTLFKQLETFIYFAGAILVIIAFIIAIYLTQHIVKPIVRIKDFIATMSKGIMPKEHIKERNDEIGEMGAALNSLIRGLKETTDFSLEIGKGNFDSYFVPLSEGDDLGNTLLDMRSNLKKAAEEAALRKKEDDQRNWASQGVAKFSDILRQNNDDIEKLSYYIISNLVKYCKANQGGLFLINDDNSEKPFVEMAAAYAFNRKKFLEKKIDIGVGIIGRVIQESETIYMTDIPNDYLKITSGLGDENPRSLLVVPLVVNETVYGAMELASFNEFEKYQIDFVEKIGENIASTLSTAKINIKTTQLLETTKQQAEEMKAQEEEMRQNMEELQATQEESARREAELKKQVKEFENFKKHQESVLKKLDGNISGEFISTIDDDEDDMM
ncbi:MAG: GAF domain-containing protein [Bacteroidales bacterium]|nr:GAF domain-containing protein [Bacteroidales bacterium]